MRSHAARARWLLPLALAASASCLRRHNLYQAPCRPFAIENGHVRPLATAAVLISGSSRTFYEAWPSIHRFLFEAGNVDAFAAVNLPPHPATFDCWQFAALAASPSLRSLHAFVNTTADVLDHVKSTTNPGFPYANRRGDYCGGPCPPHYFDGIMLQHYWNARAYALMDQAEKRHGHTYQTVVRVRPDFVFLNPGIQVNVDHVHAHAVAKLGGDLSTAKLDGQSSTTALGEQPPTTALGRAPPPNYIMIPNGNKMGGITDAIGIMSRDAARHYYNVLSYIEKILVSLEPATFHPESLLSNVINKSNATILYIDDYVADALSPGSSAPFVFDFCLRRRKACTMSIYGDKTCDLPSEHASWEGWIQDLHPGVEI